MKKLLLFPLQVIALVLAVITVVLGIITWFVACLIEGLGEDVCR